MFLKNSRQKINKKFIDKNKCGWYHNINICKSFDEEQNGLRKFPESCRLVRGSIFPPIIYHLGAFRQKGVSQVERNGFLPLQRSVLFDTAECGKIKLPNESGTVELYFTPSPLDFS